MAESLMIEKSRAQLVLLHDIKEPTEEQVAIYALYGERAPFLQKREQAYRMNMNESGGIFTMQKNELEHILFEIKGTSKLLTMLCDEPAHFDKQEIEAFQEALFRIDELLKKDIAKLEGIIYKG